jgi:hypothetical protein
LHVEGLGSANVCLKIDWVQQHMLALTKFAHAASIAATGAAVHTHPLCLLCLCRLIALPEYKRRAAAAAAAAAAAHTPGTGCVAVASSVEHFLCACKALDYPPAQRQLLQSQATNVLRRLQKAEEVPKRICFWTKWLHAVDMHVVQQCSKHLRIRTHLGLPNAD